MILTCSKCYCPQPEGSLATMGNGLHLCEECVADTLLVVAGRAVMKAILTAGSKVRPWDSPVEYVWRNQGVSQ